MKSEVQTTKSPHGDMEPKAYNFFGKALLQIRLRLGAVSKLGFSFSAKKDEPWAAGVYSKTYSTFARGEPGTGRGRKDKLETAPRVPNTSWQSYPVFQSRTYPR